MFTIGALLLGIWSFGVVISVFTSEKCFDLSIYAIPNFRRRLLNALVGLIDGLEVGNDLCIPNNSLF